MKQQNSTQAILNGIMITCAFAAIMIFSWLRWTSTTTPPMVIRAATTEEIAGHPFSVDGQAFPWRKGLSSIHATPGDGYTEFSFSSLAANCDVNGHISACNMFTHFAFPGNIEYVQIGNDALLYDVASGQSSAEFEVSP